MTRKRIVLLVLLATVCVAAALYFHRLAFDTDTPSRRKPLAYRPCQPLDTSGFLNSLLGQKPWKDPTDLQEIQKAFDRLAQRNLEQMDKDLSHGLPPEREIRFRLVKVSLLLYDGQAEKAYEVLQDTRNWLERSDELSEQWLYTVVYFQGVVGLRRGENDNCIDCRGEGACLFPLAPSALHPNPTGSRLAIQRFTEYLEQFPDDLGARWLLNLAFMTLGQHPGEVPSSFLLHFDKFGSEAGVGRFRDVAHLVGVDRFNMAGGAIMDDFNNDGLLDLLVSTWDAHQSLAFYANKGDGTFEDRSEVAGLSRQIAGFNLVQTDYNNDGFLDVYVSRGGWLPHPMRPSLLRNNGNGTFTDVTREAGLLHPVNSMSAAWADYDNDSFLDLFVCSERSHNRLYRNRGNGTFEEVALSAGVQGKARRCKGAVWFDYDNDGYPDLLVTYLDSIPQLFHNNRDGSFTDATKEMGITGPKIGFSCWAFDYDNDGWPDLFITSYERGLGELVRGVSGQSPSPGVDTTRLYRNLGGKKFQDVSRETGVNGVFATMGSNFADFDNDGYLDFYLGTGDPNLETVVPNRMFRNVSGRRFVDVTATSRTGQLQKGHGVACGDWDRDGNVDLFIELGGATPGDRYRNALFQNPGQGNNWLTVKLVGTKTNRAAVGARLKVVTAGDRPRTVYRWVCSGSSFGANPLQQTIGLAKADLVARLEVFWPTSRTTQVFERIAVNQAIEVKELAPDYRKLNWKRIPLPDPGVTDR
ncbi:MAG TPA: CRTAC1 family protein [Gemmataceae bacterium]|jgi:hypothetical protein